VTTLPTVPSVRVRETWVKKSSSQLTEKVNGLTPLLCLAWNVISSLLFMCMGTCNYEMGKELPGPTPWPSKLISRFEPMTNKSPRHNFTVAPRLALYGKHKRKYV